MRVGNYKWTKARFVIGVLSQLIGQVAFTCWALYLWINVRDYGSQHECNNEVKYVVMFFTIRATKRWLRGLWIAVVIMSAVGHIINQSVKLAHYTLMREDAQAEQSVQEVQEEEGGVEEGEEAEDENKESDRGCYFRWRHLNVLYVISLSPVSNAH
jgi:hypothetical protein